MRNPIAGYLGIALLAGLALASVSRAQSQTTPPPQPQSQQNPDSLADAAAKAKEAKSGTAVVGVDLLGRRAALGFFGFGCGVRK